MQVLPEIYASRSLDTGNGRPPVKCKLRNWWDGKETYSKCKELYGKAHGAHATPSEVAVTQFAYPDHIKTAPLSPEIAPNGGFTDAKDIAVVSPTAVSDRTQDWRRQKTVKCWRSYQPRKSLQTLNVSLVVIKWIQANRMALATINQKFEDSPLFTGFERKIDS